jgi:hypothetical protein
MSQHVVIKIERKKDDDIFDAISEGDLKKKISQNVAETFKSNSEDENIFKSICGGVLKKKISQNVLKTFKSNLVDVHITGSFRNNKSWWRWRWRWRWWWRWRWRWRWCGGGGGINKIFHLE